MDARSDIPGNLIHGRYDIPGPVTIAGKAHLARPGVQLHILDYAGHGGGAFPRYQLAVCRTLTAVFVRSMLV